MAWYRTGTVAVTNNGTGVTGTGTAFIANVKAGDEFNGPDDRSYEIASVNSDTQLTLASVYKGATAATQAYSISPTTDYARAQAVALATLISNYSTIASNAGAGKFGDGTVAAPGISFGSNPNTGFFRPASNVVALSTNGAERLRVSSGGFVGIGTDTPGYKIDVKHVSDTEAVVARFSVVNTADTDNGQLQFLADAINNVSAIRATGLNGTALRFDTGSTGRVWINSAGNVSVATSSAYATPFTATPAMLTLGSLGSKAVAVLRGAHATDAGSTGVLALQRTAAASADTLGQTASGDYLGLIEASGVTSSPALAAGVRVTFVQDGAATASAVPAAIVFATASTSTPVEAMRINSAREVAIGHTQAGHGRLSVQAGRSSNNGSATTNDSTTIVDKYLGAVTDAAAGYVALCETYTSGSVAASGFDGVVSFYRGTDTATNVLERVRVAIKTAYQTNSLLELSGTRGLITFDYNGVNYTGINLGVGAARDVYVSGRYWKFSPFLVQAANATNATNLHSASDFRAQGNTAFVMVGGATALHFDANRNALLGGGSTSYAANVGLVGSGTITPRLQVQGTNAGTSSLMNARFSGDVNPAYMILAKSRGAAIGTHGAVQNGDELGILTFQGSDGTDFREAARIEGLVDGATVSSSSMPGRLAFFTVPSGSVTATEAARINNAQQLLVGQTAATGDAKLQVSNGIRIGTAVQSADANTLDYYEEGTWTPTIIGLTTAGAGTYTAQVGRYTRTGNRVHATAYVAWTAHTGAGDLLLSGLPFASANVTNATPVGAVMASNLTFSGQLVCGISPNTSRIWFNGVTSAAATSIVAMDTAATLWVSITYEV